MLVIDEYKDLVALENLLRRVGFDVLSVGKELLVNDALLRFHPELVIATAKGRSVEGPRLALRLRKLSPPPRVVLVTNGPLALSPELRLVVDGVIETPIQPEVVLMTIAKVAGTDSEQLLAKYGKITTSAKWAGPESRKVLGEERAPVEAKPQATIGRPTPAYQPQRAWHPVANPGNSAAARSERSDRYDKFLKDNDLGKVDGVMSKEKSQAAMRDLKKHAETQRETLAKIDEEKLAFAKSLFDEADEADDGDR